MSPTNDPNHGRYVECELCGATEELHWTPRVNAELIEYSLCSSCNFWREKTAPAVKNNPNTARIGGEHYTICPELSNPSWSGYGGRRFDIWFFDGRVVTTTNLWHQGSIPEHFQKQLPDNAEFIYPNNLK